MTAYLEPKVSGLELLEEELEEGDSWLPEGDAQREYISYATKVLRIWFQQRQDVYVTGNLQLFYDPDNSRIYLAPDTFVVFGVSKQNRSSYKIWESGNRVPAFVLEITSESTAKRDQGDKKQIYQDLGVQEYVQYDPTGQYLQPSALVGYRLVDGLYEPMVLGHRSGIPRLMSEVLQLELRLLPQGLRFYDPLTTNVLLTHEEAEQARLAAEQRQLAAEQARLAAEERQLAAEQARLAAEQARLVAEQSQLAAEQARSAAEDRQLAAEQARISTEQVNQRLLDRLRSLGIDPEVE